MAGVSSSLLADLLLVPSHIRPKLKTESKESLDQAAGTKKLPPILGWTVFGEKKNRSREDWVGRSWSSHSVFNNQVEKGLNDDEELQEEKLVTMSQLFQNNHNQPHSYHFGKASFTMPLTNSCCTKGTPVWLEPWNGLNRTPNPYTASLHRTWNVNARTDLWALSINSAKQIYLLLVSLTS